MAVTNLHRKLYDSFKADTAINTVLQALSEEKYQPFNTNEKSFPCLSEKNKSHYLALIVQVNHRGK